jgi:hypothetical protein
MTTNWRDLTITVGEGETGNLGEIADNYPETLDGATIVNGAIDTWTGHFLSAPGETPDWDTPRGAVDWTGFEDALARGRG